MILRAGSQPLDERRDERPWFVVWTHARAEKRVERRLAGLGLGTWLPLLRERHRWSDRWREVECPLFPCYVFARADGRDYSGVLRTPGVLTVVKEGREPARLTDAFVASLQRAIGSDAVEKEAVVEPVAYLPGDEVIVQEGPLSGLRGVVREQRSRRQLVVWVSGIGRGVAFTIGATLVASVGGSPYPAPRTR